MKKRFSFPHPFVLLTSFVILAMVLSYVIPAGQYDRKVDETTGRDVVISGSYHTVPQSPVGLFNTFVAIPRGMIEAADVIFLVFLLGGAFYVVDKTQALKFGVSRLTERFRGRESIVIIVMCLVFATGGALNNTQEEIIALVPVLLFLTNGLGYTPIVAVAMSLGAAGVGAAFSPVNPFQVIIAQKLSQLPLLSGSMYRIVFLVIALSAWIVMVVHYARKTRTSGVTQSEDASATLSSSRSNIVLLLVLLAFVIMITGIINWGWDYNEMSACFFIMGILAGLVGKLGFGGTAKAYVEGFRAMTFGGLLIGFARSISVVLEDGQIIDSIVHGMFIPLQNLPIQLSAIAMMVSHTVIHVPVPSVSGQAVLTLPLLVPLSDLIGLSRQVTITAYQYGAGLTDIITPTNGGLVAVLAAAGVNYLDWFRFVFKRFLILLGIGAVALLIGIYIGI